MSGHPAAFQFRARSVLLSDELLTHFSWITDLLQRPIAGFFAVGTKEHAVLTVLRNGWGKRDTAELLKGLSTEYGEAAGPAVERFHDLNIRKDWPERKKGSA